MKNFSSITRVSSRRNSRARQLRLIGGTALVLLALIFLAPTLLRSVVAVAMVPMVSLQQWFLQSPHGAVVYLRERASLQAEVDRLRAELAATIEDSSETARLEAENQKLRELIGNEPEPALVAAVRAQPPRVPYDTLLVDAGEQDGVVVGAPVYAGKNVVIGIVSAVFPNTSVVTLITTPGVASTVYVYGPNIYTTAVGVGAGVLEIGIPQGIAIAPGDPVIAPSLSAGIFGAVSDVVSVASEPEQFAYVTQPLALSELLFVRIGREALPELDFDTARTIVDATRISAGLVPVPEGVLIEGPLGTSTATSTATTTVPVGATTSDPAL